MSTITTRAGKGSPLTNNEVDANFTNLNTDKAELSGAAFTGAITTTSTVDGRDVATDGTKLDGIEAGADVTDTANVTAAGALMDSELTSIASVKALDQGVATTDSPTFAGITLATADINSGTIDGTTIGASSASTGAFTTLTATGAFTSVGIDDNATSTAITIDSSENVGIGVVPKTWYSTSTALEIGSMSLEDYGVSGANVSVFANNLYRNTSNAYVYKETDFAASYSQYNGVHTFNTAPSGTADSVATLTAAMKIDSTGIDVTGRAVVDGLSSSASIVGTSNSNSLGGTTFTSAISTVGLSSSAAITSTSNSNSLGGTSFTSSIDVTGTATMGGVEVSDTDDIRIRLLNGATFKAGIQVATTAGDMIAGSAVDDLAIRAQTNMLFATGGNTERFRISSSGKLTYGGLSYGVAVDPDGFGGFGSGYNFETNGGSPRHLVTGPVAGQYLSAGSSPFVAWYTGTSVGAGTSAPERMRIDASGNVGIGTSSMSSSYGKLTVAGTGISITPDTAAKMQVGRYNAANPYSYIKAGSTSSGFKFTNAADTLDILTIENGGNVGIGTSSPSSTLEVAGSSNSTYLKIGGDDASNGRALTFTSSASASFNGAVHTINALSSQGVIAFATSSTERMRIDSAGNLLVGVTSPQDFDSTTTNGHTFYGGSTDVALHSRNNANPLALQRTGNDGSICNFYKNTTTVGSIGNYGGLALDVGKGTTAVLRFRDSLNAIYPAAGVAGGTSDGVTSLGISSGRFKDLYLSGGVYLGGTGAANKLDDYEEGNWTTGLNSGSFSNVTAKYTKIGRVVTLTLDAIVGSGGGSTLTLPFTCTNTTANAIYVSNQDFVSGRTQMCWVAASNLLYFRTVGDNIVYAAQALTAGATIHGSITYTAA